jgi:beta-lactamase regulating signal transducer with metallopeptidase domain
MGFVKLPVESTAPVAAALSWWNVAEIVWATGAVSFLVFQVVRHIRFTQTTRRWSEAVISGPVYETLIRLQEEAGITRTVSLFRCPCVNTPLAMGIVRPRILLPHLIFDEGELKYVLMHELVHIKRKDLYYRVLTLIANAAHWFNPLVYMMGRAVSLLCEISCDDEVVKGTDSDARLRYSETIIGVVKYQSRLQTALSTGFYGGKKGMKMRISSIMDAGRKKMGAVLLCASLIMPIGTGAVFAATFSAPVPSVNGYDILDILRQFEAPGISQTYSPPEEGLISRGAAMDVAEAYISTMISHLNVFSSAAGMGIASAEAGLVRTLPEGHDGSNDLPDPKYSFWEVTLHSPGDEVATFLIHAATGTVWYAEISGWGYWIPSLSISVDKALYGFMTDLGLPAYPYTEDSIMLSEEVTDTAVSRSLSPDNEVFATASITTAPCYEEGRLIDDHVALTIRYELTTEPAR